MTAVITNNWNEMESKFATSIDQSRRLLTIGVNPDTADMHWCSFLEPEPFLVLGEIPRDNETGEMSNEGDVPAWSLSALLEIIPQRILGPHADTPCDFILHHHPDLWIAMYHDGKTFGDSEDYTWQCCSECRADNPIEACVRMIGWLVGNNYPLNTIV